MAHDSSLTPTPAPAAVQHLPDMVVESTEGIFNLQSLTGQPVLIYFYPKDLTAGCTTQAQDFSHLHAEFKKLGVNIYGVSRDSLKTHERFIAKENINFALISDPDEVLCRTFDVIKNKNMYGKIVQGIERSSFLFDATGSLVHSWRKVRAKDHADLVLQFIQQHELQQD